MDTQLAWSREARWPAHPLHVSDARTFVLDCLTETDLGRQAHAVALVVSELATNVVLHANTPFTVTLARRDSWLVLEVRDHLAGQVAVPAPTDEVELHGRGLEIVQALSQAWGVWPRRDGKSVWAAFDLESPDADGHDEDGHDEGGRGAWDGGTRRDGDVTPQDDGADGDLPPWCRY
ncbi:ATP-binding protein [Pedococcus sp. NPDC057267]|uniref:ATP-binding protein n=1 Tax=Pedococcus sp. NPDC057267 TaxID=3346077 RepID=UPI00363BBBEA